jgi:metacaspase-1
MCKLCQWLFPKPPKPTEEPEPIIEPDPIPEVKREKYALIVGINNYIEPGNDLSGCVNDQLKTKLIEMFNFFYPDHSEIRVLVNEEATYNNIIRELRWLVSHENAELIYQNSSHGTFTPDLDGDEEDGYDEALVTYDCQLLLDDTLGDIFDTVPKSSFLTFICDSCHSGTISRSFKSNPGPFNIRFLKPQFKAPSKIKIIKRIGARAAFNHVVISACTDRQFAADAYIDGMWQGAFTHALKQHISPYKTWSQIYPDILKTLQDNGFSQTPQLVGRELGTRPIFGGA